MAITYVSQADAEDSGPFGTDSGDIDSLTISTPASLADSDVLLAVILLPRWQWYRIQATTSVLMRYYTISTPAGWTFAGKTDSVRPTQAVNEMGMWLFYRVVPNAAGEAASHTFDIKQNRISGEPANDDTLGIIGGITAYRGVASNVIDGSVIDPQAVNIDREVGGGGTITFPTAIGLEVLKPNSMIVQIAAGQTDVPTGSSDPADLDFDSGVSRTQRWKETGPEVTAVSSYTGTAGTTANASRIYTGVLLWGDELRASIGVEPFDDITGDTGNFCQLLLALVDAAEADTDAPPTGPPGTTGVGYYLPESVLSDVLDLQVWQDDLSSAIELFQGFGASPPAIGGVFNFNSMGACTDAEVFFAANPGVIPFGSLMKFRLEQTTDPASVASGSGFISYVAPVWYTAVVRNVEYRQGIYTVKLIGCYDLVKDAFVSIDESASPDEVLLPTLSGVFTNTLNLHNGLAVTIEVGEESEFTTNNEWNAQKFAVFPDAAWGVGPDLVYIQGRPQDATPTTLDAGIDNSLILAARPSEFTLTNYITDWYYDDGGGGFTSTSRTVTLLTPRRTVKAVLDSGSTVIQPPEASAPTYQGPVYEVQFAGLAVPPILLDGLPDGARQYAAGARVEVMIGEEGRVPRIRTTLLTEALPFIGELID